MKRHSTPVPATLRYFRRLSKLSQGEIAEASGQWTSTISRMERGERQVSIPVLMAYANLCNQPTDAFFYEPRFRHPKPGRSLTRALKGLAQ